MNPNNLKRLIDRMQDGYLDNNALQYMIEELIEREYDSYTHHWKYENVDSTLEKADEHLDTYPDLTI